MHITLRRYDFHRPIRVLALVLLCSLELAAAEHEPGHVMNLYGAEKNLPMNLIIDNQLRSDF